MPCSLQQQPDGCGGRVGSATSEVLALEQAPAKASASPLKPQRNRQMNNRQRNNGNRLHLIHPVQAPGPTSAADDILLVCTLHFNP
jgi:hypothetical protein